MTEPSSPRTPDMPPEQRELADRLYAHRGGQLWRGPCGHPASSMWVRDDLVIVCAARGEEWHVSSDLHFAGGCEMAGSGCTVRKCGRTYAADDLR